MADSKFKTKDEESSLSLDLDSARTDALADGGEAVADPQLDKLADEFVSAVMSFDQADTEARSDRKRAIELLGAKAQKQSGHRSRMLQGPIRDLSKKGADGGPVANALVELAVETSKLDPNSWDFSVTGFAKVFSFIPGVGNKLQKYFLQYESAQGLIDGIIKSLEEGRNLLQRDNSTLTEDQKIMRSLTLLLQKQIKIGELIDRKLSYQLERELTPEDERYKFIAEELLFPLRQRIIDLQQQLAVNQQGILAIELIIRNNKELVRGVNRAINVTVSALQVAVTVALALAHQKLVLDKVELLNATTSDLIAGTAKRLRTQGAAIHKQASSAMLDIESLKGAFEDINAALEDISQFRQEALPKMASQILEMDELAKKGEQSIQRLEQGTAASAKVINKDWTELLEIE